MRHNLWGTGPLEAVCLIYGYGGEGEEVDLVREGQLSLQ